MTTVTLHTADFESVRKMTSRQQVLIYLAIRSLEEVDKRRIEPYDRLEDIREITKLSLGTIKDALGFLVLDGHLGKKYG